MDIRNIAEIQATSSAAAWLFLLTVQLNGEEPIYLVNNNLPITSNGITYEPFPFDLTLPSDTGDKLPTINLVISNISSEIIEAFRIQKNPPTITLELINSLYPDLVEKRLDFLKVRSVSYDAINITCTLEVINVMTSSFPDENYNPTNFPALFR